MMPFDKPKDAIRRVLAKVGVDPVTRIHADDQDPEYTSCQPEELSDYFRLYQDGSTDPDERAVLCCFMLECLNDFCAEGAAHPLQGAVFDALLDAGDTHATEIAYWSESDDPDPENWWPIAESIIEHKAARAQRPTAVSSAGLSMRGLELRDADSRGFLSFDLRDILACLGRDAIERMWTWQDVDCTGEGVDEFFEAVYQRQAIPGSRLIELSRRVLISDGIFYGRHPGEDAPSIVIKSVNSTLWEVFGSDESLRKIESGFTNVRPASPDAG